jgi:3-mercaptopyruvate sulfurtransferase SseA
LPAAILNNEDVSLYDTGHIPGAVHVDWHKDLNDQSIRDFLDPQHFAALASQIGITPETTLVFYGEKSNWWACYALWVFTLFGHKDLRIASLIVSGGKIVGIRFAIIDFPDPGGPMQRMFDWMKHHGI